MMSQSFVSSRSVAKPIAFRSLLSLDYLWDFWQREERENTHGLGDLARRINTEAANHPELRGAISDRSVLHQHRKLLEAVFSAVLPAGLESLPCTALSAPDDWNFFHTSARFRRELLDADGQLRAELLTDGMSWSTLGMLFSYLAVLRHCYGIRLPFEKSVLLRVVNQSTGLLATYQLRAQFDMTRIRPVGELSTLDEDLLLKLREGHGSFDLWEKLLPRERFEYYGFVVYEAFEVTEEVTRSHLTELLVQQDPFTQVDEFHQLQQLLRSYLRLDTLKLAVIGIEGDAGFCFDGDQGLSRELDPREIDSLICGDDRTDLSCGRTVIHAEFCQAPGNSPLLDSLHEKGARSVLLMPLTGEAGLLGALCLTTERPHQLTSLTRLALQGMAAAFTLALQRTLASVQYKVQAVLKEKFTAIHPSVEWKFRAAALRFVRGQGEVGDLVFPNVYSLYSASDIRSSSQMRNQAIQTDLIQQLEGAKAILQTAQKASQVDYLNALTYRLSGLVSELELGVRSGDEARVARFLTSEVEPMFDSLENFGTEVQDSVEGYRAFVNQATGTEPHNQRQAYEHAVDRLSTVQTEILTAAQQQAQAVFPHLFLMYRTDGVEHSMYIGDSLSERTDFSLLYLKELKLWQLRVVAEMALASIRLQSELSLKLQVAHLILAQADPIALRFSQEEKKFNVDGAYNTRYEIIKKRIDKAHVKGSEERVSQPGMISIFFSQPAEEHEYRHFINYLGQQGVLSPGIERIDVEDLPGVHGLHALRVAVNLESWGEPERFSPSMPKSGQKVDESHEVKPA